MTYEPLNVDEPSQNGRLVETNKPNDSLETIVKPRILFPLCLEVGDAEDLIEAGLGGLLEADGTRTHAIYSYYSESSDKYL
jgi:hypothetical protein